MKKKDLIALLVKIGMTKANAEKIAANTPDESATSIDDKDLTALVDDFKKNQLELHKNDPELIGEIQRKEYSKNKDIFVRKLKQQFGLNADDVKTVTTTKDDAGVKIEVIDVEALIELARTRALANKDKGIETLQEELLTANKTIKELKEVEIPKIQGEATAHKKNVDIKNAIVKLANEFTKDLIVTPAAATAAATQYLMSHEVEINEEGDIVSVKKGGLAIKNADSTGILTAKDLLKAKFETDGFLKKSNAGAAGAPAEPVIITKEEGGQHSPKNNLHLDKAKAHEETLKKEATKTE